MIAEKFYDSIHTLTYKYDCTEIPAWKWDELMENAKRGNVRKINLLVKRLVPELFASLGLNEKPIKDLGWYNPYPYYKTSKHIIIVHSSIEYFLKIN